MYKKRCVKKFKLNWILFRNTAFRKLKKKVNKAFRPWAVSLYIISFYIHYFLLLAWAENAPTDPYEPSDYMYYNISIRDWIYIKKSAYLLHLTALVLIPSTLSPSLFLWTLSRETVTEDMLSAMQIVSLKGNLLNIYYWAVPKAVPHYICPNFINLPTNSLFIWTLPRLDMIGCVNLQDRNLKVDSRWS